LWSLSRRPLAFALTVEIFAVTVAAVTGGSQPISRQDWIRLAILSGCAIAHIELTRGVERVRSLPSGTGPFITNDGVWCVAAVVALPAALASIVVVVVFTWSWLRVWRGRRPLYRWVFSGAAGIVSTLAAAAVLALDPGTFPGVPIGPAALGLAVVAGAVRWLVNFCLVSCVIMLSTPNLPAGRLLSVINERVLEIGAFGLGIVSAALLNYNPMLLAGIVGGVAATHRVLLVGQFQHAARTDGKTELNSAGWWQQVATAAFHRARLAGAGLGILMLDLDHFKRVNDTYGHLAGDHVLRAVASAITGEIRDGDTAGRWGGEEFAVLAPNVDAAELTMIAERIRRRVHALIVSTDQSSTIQDLTISIGAACYPDSDIAGIDDLVAAADTALYAAKTNGRNQVRLATRERALDRPGQSG
jgi:diguanylate cyclase (GGDEF)-like protein